MMDIDKLDMFFAAANSENFTTAARKCHVAQTTMSKYISQLEEELGVALFYRTTRECVMTEAGHIFYNGAKELRSDYDSLQKQLQHVSENELRIGLYGEFFDLSILSRFSSDNPSIQLKVIFGSSDSLFDQLRRRKIHALLIPDILVPENRIYPSFRSIDITTGEAMLYCSRDAVSQYGSIDKVISALPYITKAIEADYHESCRNLIRECYGTTFHDIIVVDSRARQELMVQLSQGFGIMLPSELSDFSNLVSSPLEGRFSETLRLYYSIKHTPDSLMNFINYIRSVNG